MSFEAAANSSTSAHGHRFTGETACFGRTANPFRRIGEDEIEPDALAAIRNKVVHTAMQQRSLTSVISERFMTSERARAF